MATPTLIIRSRDINHPELGFQATLDGRDFRIEASLPPLSPDLCDALENWKSAYLDQDGVRSHYRMVGGQVRTRTVRDVIELSKALRTQLNRWLNPPDQQYQQYQQWRKVRETLIDLSHRPEPLLMIDLEENDLKRLPWQDWELLADRYPRTDAALMAVSDSIAMVQPIYPQAAKIRILVIVGESTDIQTATDLQSIENLQTHNPARIEVISLPNPTTKALQAALNDPQGYHILVYLGHSKSSDDGQIGWLLLNQTDELSIADFRLALKKIVKRGLQLAIFNSCDGLGLAQQLAQLNVPRCIVMKEPVPDLVAIEFIDRFFHQFVQERQSLLHSVRLASQELEHFNTQYSEVTWLPTLCLKQNAEPLTWQTLLDQLQPNQPLSPSTEAAEATTADRAANAGQATGTAQATGDKRAVKTGMLALGALALVGAILLGNRLIQNPPVLPLPVSPSGSESDSPSDSLSGSVPVSLLPAAALISTGGTPIEDSMIPLSGQYVALKQEGMTAFAKADYQTARDVFAQIRADAKTQWQQFKASPTSPEYQAADQALKDPTILIYQNNAEVRLRHAKGEPIYSIAAVSPLSLNLGQQMLFGVAQAQDQVVNVVDPAVGKAPINLEIVVANDRNDPEQAVAVAKALMVASADRQILAVVGHYISTSTCDALRSAYVPAQVPVVSPLSTRTDLRQDCGNSNLFFRTTSSTKIEAATLVNYLTRLKPRPKVAVFYNKRDLFSLDIFNQFQATLNAANGTVIQAFDLSEISSVEATLKQVSDVDALAVLPDGRNSNSDAFNRAIEIIKANQGEKLILGSNPLYDITVITQGGPLKNLQNRLVLATDWYRKCAPSGQGSFVATAETEYWFGGLNRATALSYEAIQAVSNTLRPGVTSAQIQQKLSVLKGVKSAVFKDKTISFDANGDRQELTTRILATPGSNANNPFELVTGTSCP